MAGPLSWISQIAAVARYNLKTLPQRKGSSTAAVIGIAGVVAVMVSVLSIAHGNAPSSAYAYARYGVILCGGRVRIEQVGVQAASPVVRLCADKMKHIPDHPESVVAIQEPRPEIDLPGHRPARSSVTTIEQ